MKKSLHELPSLFFSMRQIIRSRLPEGKADPNAWTRFETLRYIHDAKGPTMHDVAKFLRIKAPSATSLVAYLVAAGLVRRIAGKKDKRVTRLHLTARGKKLLAQHRKRSDATMHKVFARFSEKDIKGLARILRRLRDVHE